MAEQNNGGFIGDPNEHDEQGVEEIFPDDLGDDMSEFDGDIEPPEDQFRDDVEADADTLASAGYGTDEDYGFFGNPFGDE